MKQLKCHSELIGKTIKGTVQIGDHKVIISTETGEYLVMEAETCNGEDYSYPVMSCGDKFKIPNNDYYLEALVEAGLTTEEEFDEKQRKEQDKRVKQMIEMDKNRLAAAKKVVEELEGKM